MYLYFNKKGVLKEIINDEALRQGNYAINKIYIYVEDRTYTSVDVSYLLPSGLIVGPTNYDDFTEDVIPFDRKRDLKYFRYGKEYNFCVIDLEEDLNGNGPLDEAGLVHCNLVINLINESMLQLGELNFTVELDSVLNQHYVASEEYLSLSNYKYLRYLLNTHQESLINYVDLTGTDNVITEEQVETLQANIMNFIVYNGRRYYLFESSETLTYAFADTNILRKIVVNPVELTWSIYNRNLSELSTKVSTLETSLTNLNALNIATYSVFNDGKARFTNFKFLNYPYPSSMNYGIYEFTFNISTNMKPKVLLVFNGDAVDQDVVVSKIEAGSPPTFDLYNLHVGVYPSSDIFSISCYKINQVVSGTDVISQGQFQSVDVEIRQIVSFGQSYD